MITEKTKKQAWAWVMAFTLFLACLLMAVPQTALAEDDDSKTDDTTVDFVLVMDCSDTMGVSDPEQLVMSAAQMFVDMLPAENARLAIIVFGKDYSLTGENYDLSQLSDLSEEVSRGSAYGKNHVRLVQDLTDITTQDSKNAAKTAIASALNEDVGGGDTYTPIGYALELANYILEQGGAAQNSAGIILMTDGRLNGQSEEDSYDSGLKSYSVDNAVAKLRANEWPVYCMELNMDDENDTGTYFTNKRAKYQMRENIPNSEDEHFEVENAADAQSFFADIFTTFFDVTPEAVTELELVDGKCSRDIELDEMIAETNITLTGSIAAFAEIQDIVITDSKGNSVTYTESTVETSRIVTFGNNYITVKLLTPSAGTWNVTVHGSSDVEIGLYAVSIHEMDLQLTTDATSDYLAKGTTLNFTSSFVYHDSPYASETIYSGYPATLWIDGPGGGSFTMDASEQGYSYSFTFTQSGTYTIKAYVDGSDLFRTGRKESGEYTFTVGNIETSATDTSIPTQTTNPGGSTDTIDCSQYFTNEDGDTLTYSVNYDQASGISASIDGGGLLTLSAGSVAGEYEITVGAKDPVMETAATQSFTLTVVNQAMTWADGTSIVGDDETDGKTSDSITAEFCYNANALPGFISKLVSIPSETELRLQWADYFTDPDGINPVVTVTETSASDAITMTTDDTGMTAVATAKGEAEYLVTASDSSDSSISATITVKVKSLNALGMLWKVIRIPVIIAAVILVLLIIFLVAAFGGRKIYGIWDVSGGGYYETDRKLGSTRSGKKKKCKLDSLLDDLNIPNGFGNVELKAGNNLNKAVYLVNLKGLESIDYNGSELSDPSKVKKLKIGSHQSVTLMKDGVTVTMERH